jgi:Periplasmic protease
MKKVVIIFLFFVYLLGIQANAKPKKIESIPFEMVGSYVVITVKINDSSPLNLILDSGIRNTIITELEPADKISLNYSDVKDMMGLGGGTHLEAFTSNFNTLKVGKLKLENKTVYVLQEDVFNLSKHSGTKINGLIGVDFFQDHVVEIDYSSKHIRFYDSKNFETPKGYSMLPIMIESQKMFVELTVLQTDSTRKQVKMLMDTGAELNAWFQTSSKESVRIPPKWVQGTIGEGLNGIITGKYSHIPQICFGNFCLKNAIVSFPDSATINGIVSNSKRDGTVGSQLLSRFNLYFDYKQKKFYFKPNSNFKGPFSYNVAGIEIIQYSPVIPVIEVMDVWANSPAAHAGVKKEDQLVEINGTRAFQMSIGEIRKIFETPSKRPLNLTLKRGKDEITVRIDMKDKF